VLDSRGVISAVGWPCKSSSQDFGGKKWPVIAYAQRMSGEVLHPARALRCSRHSSPDTHRHVLQLTCKLAASLHQQQNIQNIDTGHAHKLHTCCFIVHSRCAYASAVLVLDARDSATVGSRRSQPAVSGCSMPSCCCCCCVGCPALCADHCCSWSSIDAIVLCWRSCRAQLALAQEQELFVAACKVRLLLPSNLLLDQGVNSMTAALSTSSKQKTHGMIVMAEDSYQHSRAPTRRVNSSSCHDCWNVPKASC
jgi:hypothetical protein